MDPSLDPPDTKEQAAAAAEPPAHIAHAANPTPPLAHNNTHNHPPYAEMITGAITALKEKDGSSRQAIAKYIEKAYTNLPSTHSALLTHHLKRLKNNGHLLMVKHSYKLPRSLPLSTTTTTTTDTTAAANGNTNTSSSSGSKRGPGRPPKPKVLAQSNTVGPESMFVSLGLVDGPSPAAKRGPGRPPKAKSDLVGPELGGPVLGKRGRGRPPRPKSLSVLMGQGGLKRGRGRPPRTMSIGSAGVPRPIGRPKNDGSVMKAPGRPRGRPTKIAVAAPTADGGALVAVHGEVLPGKHRGRPPKAAGGGGVKKPRKLTGKPLGRPRKNASLSAIQVAATEQLVAYEDLKSKLEHFQSRIKQAVGVVKPHLNIETAVSALGALQELEELATMDMTAPLNVQVQEPLLQT